MDFFEYVNVATRLLHFLCVAIHLAAHLLPLLVDLWEHISESRKKTATETVTAGGFDKPKPAHKAVGGKIKGLIVDVVCLGPLACLYDYGRDKCKSFDKRGSSDEHRFVNAFTTLIQAGQGTSKENEIDRSKAAEYIRNCVLELAKRYMSSSSSRNIGMLADDIADEVMLKILVKCKALSAPAQINEPTSPCEEGQPAMDKATCAIHAEKMAKYIKVEVFHTIADKYREPAARGWRNTSSIDDEAVGAKASIDDVESQALANVFMSELPNHTTPMQFKILSRLSAGLDLKEIAKELRLSYDAVRQHSHRGRIKLAEYLNS